MARRIVGICLVLALYLVTAATPALAVAPSQQATDPIANSPAGVMDAIPLESARQDAAPHGRRGHGAGLGSSAGVLSAAGLPVLVPGGQPGSLSHSANGFGAASSVPGLDASAGPGLGAVQGDASSGPVLAFALAVVVMVIGAAVGMRSQRTA